MAKVNLFFETFDDEDAFLAEVDQIPIIIGFKGLLEKLDVAFSFQKNKAYVEDLLCN